MNLTLPLPVLVVLAGTIIAAITDIWKFKVHNLLTLPLILTGLLYHGLFGGPGSLAGSLLGMLFGFGILFLFYLMGGFGGGDVKLMAGVGAWLGMPLTFYVFLASALAAGLYALLVILFCGKARETWINLQIFWHRLTVVGRHLGADDSVEIEVNRAERRRRVIPFAAMVALALIVLIVFARSGGSP